jgi:membrane protease YdiL (CAAX protease family)
MIGRSLTRKASEHWHFPGWRPLAFCSFVGCAAVLLSIAIQAALGVFDWRHPPITDLHVLWTQWFPAGLVLVPLEEWIFRGIVLRHLERWIGWPIALVVSSALFSYVAHHGDVTRSSHGWRAGCSWA